MSTRGQAEGEKGRIMENTKKEHKEETDGENEGYKRQ